MNTKLTLRMDEAAISKGKRFAEQHGKSLSQLVQDYLLLLDSSNEIVDQVPVSSKLQRLVGIGTGSYDEHTYRDHLLKKND